MSLSHPSAVSDRKLAPSAGRAGLRALAVGLAGCAVIFLLVAGLLWHSHDRAVAEAEAALASIAQQQQARNDDLLQSARNLDATMTGALAPILSGFQPAAEGPAAWERIRHLLTGRNWVLALAVVTADGMQLVGTSGAQLPPRFVGSEPWFGELAGTPPRGIAVLPPRYDQSRGAWHLPVAQRVLQTDGTTLGFAIVKIRLSALVSVVAASPWHQVAQARLLRDDGMVLAAYPPDPAVLGTLQAEPPPGSGNGARVDSPLEVRAPGLVAGTVLQVTTPAGWVSAAWLERTWPFLAAAGATLLLVGFLAFLAARQIGNRADAMARLQFQNVLLSAQQDGALQGVVVTDKGGQVQYFNRQAEAIWRLHGELSAGRSIQVLLDGISRMVADPAALSDLLRQAMAPSSGSLRAVMKLRDARRVECTVKALMDASGEVIGRIWSFLDISAELQAEEAIRWRTDYDPLTHLANRSLFKRQLGSVMEDARQHGHRGALLYIDLDGFKWINDTRGHAVGDQLLVQVADRLNACVRRRAPLARLGGDEFIVMLPRSRGEADARNLARRILAAVSEPYAVDGHVCHMSASIGIVMFPSDTDDVTSLLKKADMSMYAAKAEGKNRYCFFSQEMDAAVAERQRIEADMRAALGSDQFVFHYQPIISLADGSLAGFEALLRWQHPTDGLLAPGRFIEVAEEIGLISRISSDAILRASHDLAPLFAARPELHLAVNLSVRQFQDEGLHHLISALQEAGQIPLQRFVFEITESLMMTGDENTRKMFDLVRCSGAKIAVDDFGTGYSSLVYLQNFPVDYLKVDQSFVNNMMENDDSRQLVSSILSMAKSLRMEAIAEGVESREQLLHLQAQGCELAQGFLFSPALPLAEALALVERDHPLPLIAQTASG